MIETLLFLDWDRRHWPLAAFFGLWVVGILMGALLGNVLAGLIGGFGIGGMGAVLVAARHGKR